MAGAEVRNGTKWATAVIAVLAGVATALGSGALRQTLATENRVTRLEEGAAWRNNKLNEIVAKQNDAAGKQEQIIESINGLASEIRAITVRETEREKWRERERRRR